MNGIDRITVRIDEEIRKEIDEIKRKADKDCEEIRLHYREIAQNEYWKTMKKGKEESDRLAERMRSMAQAEAKKQILALKQEMIEAAFEMAADKLASMPEEKYIDFLKSLAVNASTTGKEQIILSPADRSRFGKKAAVAANETLSRNGKTAELTLSEQTRAIRGGLILSEGNIDVNCSIDMILEIRRNELTGEVAKLLLD